jgi:hypothetical protein
MTKREISDKRFELERQERKEKEILLKEHDEKFRSARLQLYALCYASGTHEVKPCHGEISGPNFAGQFPYSCFNCGAIEWK